MNTKPYLSTCYMSDYNENIRLEYVFSAVYTLSTPIIRIV